MTMHALSPKGLGPVTARVRLAGESRHNLPKTMPISNTSYSSTLRFGLHPLPLESAACKGVFAGLHAELDTTTEVLTALLTLHC